MTETFKPPYLLLVFGQERSAEIGLWRSFSQRSLGGGLNVVLMAGDDSPHGVAPLPCHLPQQHCLVSGPKTCLQ